MIFIDTAPFIYLIEKNPDYCAQVENYLLGKASQNQLFVTSTVSIAEFCVMPFRKGRQDLVDSFYLFLSEAQIEVVEISTDIAELAGRIRAQHQSLKGMDALQIAVYLKKGCDSFLTNDFKLASIPDISAVIIANL